MSGIGYVPSFSSFPDLGKEKKKDERKARKDRDRDRDRDKQLERKPNINEEEEGASQYRKKDETHEKYSRRQRRSRSPERRRRSHSREKERRSKKSRQEANPSSRHGLKSMEAGPSSVWDPLADERAKAKEDHLRASMQEQHDKTFDSKDDSGTSSKLWFIDKKGDTLNITYGGLHQGDVPKFYRSGRGRVLGLPSVWNIKRNSGNKELEIGRWDKPKVPRYVDSKSYRLLTESRRRLVPIPSKPVVTYGDFISIKKRPSPEHVDPRETYRSITAEHAPQHSDDDESERKSSPEISDEEDEAEGTSLPAEQETIRNLEESLRKKPTDESNWLRLIELSTAFVTVRTKRAAHARTEIALSIIRRAWDANLENQNSVRLWLLYLRYGDEIWTKEDSERQWTKMIQTLGHEQAPSWKREIAWMARLDWKLGACSSISDALRSGKGALSMLQGPQYEMMRVRICWRMATFLREAGFFELAMAILQAQIELSYFCPNSLSSQSVSQRIERLEIFWETEVGRIGDKDATGWDKWEELGQPEPVSYAVASTTDSGELQDPYQRWFNREKQLDTVGTVPTRTFNEDEQDPYSTILFNDIHDFISDIQQSASKEYLRLVFLSFLGLNIPGLGRLELDALGEHSDLLDLLDNSWMLSGRRGWVAEPATLFPSIKENRLLDWESHLGAIVALEKPRRSIFGPVKDWALGRQYLEGTNTSCEGRTWEPDDIRGIDIQRIRNVFSRLRLDSWEWDEMFSAFVAAVDMKSAVKMSKQRLENRSNSSHLWKTQIRLERIRRDYTKASKMYQIALGTETQMQDIDLLYADAIEYFWFQEDENQARLLLKRALEIDESSSAALYLLRGRKKIEDLLSVIQDTAKKEIILRLQFFFELSICPIHEAIDAFKRSFNEREFTTRSQELLLSWLCITLHNLAQLRGTIVPPALVERNVAEALKSYPDNTILLGLFLEYERGQGIWGRVRNLLDDAGSSDKSLNRLAWEIWAEGQSYGPWEPDRIRNKLESALGTPRSKQSVVLWRMYLALELRNNLSKAKTILIRAIGQCWWAKEFYMMAFGPLRSEFSARELNALVEVMVDRGVRMRRDLGGFLKGWIDPSALEDEEASNGGDMEVEAMVQAREQAKPF
ncbi:hypothetical protein FRC18_010478 [Serendipita sp. 400]|nr:hypothetical protein FRC18_010478 [Serendipita sp. 400]